MACLPGGRSCRLRSRPTPAPFAPVPLSDNVTVPTLLPWASFISTTVLAAVDSAKRMIVVDTAAANCGLCFIATNYNQSGALVRYLLAGCAEAPDLSYCGPFAVGADAFDCPRDAPQI